MLALDIPPTSPPPQAEYQVLHDARAVHDIASVVFKEHEINGVPSCRMNSPGVRFAVITAAGVVILLGVLPGPLTDAVQSLGGLVRRR